MQASCKTALGLVFGTHVTCGINVVLLLGHRLRSWTNIITKRPPGHHNPRLLRYRPETELIIQNQLKSIIASKSKVKN